jgi:hypothetical protein
MYTHTFSYEGQCDDSFTKQRRHRYINSGNHPPPLRKGISSFGKYYGVYRTDKMFDRKKTELQSVKAKEMSKPQMWCLGFDRSVVIDAAMHRRSYSYQHTDIKCGVTQRASL